MFLIEYVKQLFGRYSQLWILLVVRAPIHENRIPILFFPRKIGICINLKLYKTDYKKFAKLGLCNSQPNETVTDRGKGHHHHMFIKRKTRTHVFHPSSKVPPRFRPLMCASIHFEKICLFSFIFLQEFQNFSAVTHKLVQLCIFVCADSLYSMI